MKIESMTVCNWRSVKFAKIEFQDLMIFIGQNNHGKSNLLSALLFFFGEIKANDQDFNDLGGDVFVEISFADLDDSDKATFSKYVDISGHLTVRKTAFAGGNFEYRGFLQLPDDEWLREANASAYAKRDIASALPFSAFLPSEGRLTKQDIMDAQIQYIAMKPGEVRFSYVKEETNFMGLKSVAKGIFGNLYFIPAVKDAVEDFSSRDTSAFGRIFAGIIESMSAANPEWASTKKKLSELFTTLNRSETNGLDNPNRPKELVAFEIALSAELRNWGAEVGVEIIPPDMDDVFRANTHVWIDDGVRTDIRRKGHGLQRALTFALIKVISDNIRKMQTVASGESASSRSASSSTYFILEEPELYLHPQAQRALFDSLTALSMSKNQVILCTHSSALIDVGKYKSICIVRKDSEETGTRVCQYFDDIFIGDAKKDFNLAYWINPDRSELFFAKRIILVEGATDKTVIPLLAKMLGIYRYDYTIIDCGSKDNIPLYCQLLNKFQLRYVAVYDLDHQAGKNPDALASADRSSALIDDAVNLDFGVTVVLNNDIEEEIGIIVGNRNKPYAAVNHVAAAAYVPTESLSTKIRQLYLHE